MVDWLLRTLHRRSTDENRSGDELPEMDNEVAVEEVYLSAASRFLDLQMGTNDVFDGRATSAFSTGSTVLPVTFGLLGLSSRQVSSTTIFILIAALAAYLALVFCVWRASRIRVLSYRPDMDALRENSETAPGVVLQYWVASEYVKSTEFNRPKLALKGLWVGRAITALYFEGFLLSIAAISTLL